MLVCILCTVKPCLFVSDPDQSMRPSVYLHYMPWRDHLDEVFFFLLPTASREGEVAEQGVGEKRERERKSEA